MADAFTGTSAITTDTTAYNLLALFPLRQALYFDAVVDVKPTQQSHRGAAVTFPIWSDFPAQTTELSETTDPDAIAASDSSVTLTLKEYGALVKTTAKARAMSYLDIDQDIANLLGYNAGLSIDTVARDILEAGTNVRYAGNATSRVTLDAADLLDAGDIRWARADLVKAGVQPSRGDKYVAFADPDVLVDLKEQNGGANWRDPHVYSAPENIWTGEFGAFEGFVFIETARAPAWVDGGAGGTVDVYGTLLVGKQALGVAHATTEGYGRFPTIVKGPVIDGLQRIQPLGWKWLGRHGVIRQAALRRIESASTRGVNV